VFTGHAQRWTGKEDRSEPGRMVQIDHMTTKIGNMTYKEFHAWDPKTKMLAIFIVRLKNMFLMLYENKSGLLQCNKPCCL